LDLTEHFPSIYAQVSQGFWSLTAEQSSRFTHSLSQTASLLKGSVVTAKVTFTA